MQVTQAGFTGSVIPSQKQLNVRHSTQKSQRSIQSHKDVRNLIRHDPRETHYTYV